MTSWPNVNIEKSSKDYFELLISDKKLRKEVKENKQHKITLFNPLLINNHSLHTQILQQNQIS